MTLHRAMGLNCLGFVTLSYFGMRVRKVAFRADSTRPEALDSSTTSHTSCLTRSQQWWKKFVVNPSGPGAFPRGMVLTSWFTSSWVMGHVNASFCSGVTSDEMCPMTR
jgi:hypothetical protein